MMIQVSYDKGFLKIIGESSSLSKLKEVKIDKEIMGRKDVYVRFFNESKERVSGIASFRFGKVKV